MPRPVKPPYSVRQVLVCTNVRDLSTGKPSCGRNDSVGFRDRIKALVKARGLKGQVMVTGTSCLDYCPAQGCTVAFYPENKWAIVEISPASEEAVLARALAGPEADPAAE